MIPVANSTEACEQEEFLRDAWNRASLPLQDTRPEVMENYEERQLEARSALIQHRKLPQPKNKP
jgi:hypothetical protein